MGAVYMQSSRRTRRISAPLRWTAQASVSPCSGSFTVSPMTISVWESADFDRRAMRMNGAWPSLCPAVNRSFYTNMVAGAPYGQFIRQELPMIARVLFFRFQRRRGGQFCRGSFHGRGWELFCKRCPRPESLCGGGESLPASSIPRGRIARVRKEAAERRSTRRHGWFEAVNSDTFWANFGCHREASGLPADLRRARHGLAPGEWPVGGARSVFSPAAERRIFLYEDKSCFPAGTRAGSGVAPYL